MNEKVPYSQWLEAIRSSMTCAVTFLLVLGVLFVTGLALLYVVLR